MAEKRIGDRDRERGARLVAVREALGLTQLAIVEALNEVASELELPARYQFYTVSRMEQGSIRFDDVAIYAAIDPEQRGWEWIVYGERGMPTLRRSAEGRGLRPGSPADRLPLRESERELVHRRRGGGDPKRASGDDHRRGS